MNALGISEQALRTSMAGRVLSAGGELVSKEHTLSDSNYTRLALAKAAYDRLFTWIVQQVCFFLPQKFRLGKPILIIFFYLKADASRV